MASGLKFKSGAQLRIYPPVRHVPIVLLDGTCMFPQTIYYRGVGVPLVSPVNDTFNAQHRNVRAFNLLHARYLLQRWNQRVLFIYLSCWWHTTNNEQ